MVYFKLKMVLMAKEDFMKPVLTIIVLAFFVVSLAGCLYTHITVPYGTELNKTELGH